MIRTFVLAAALGALGLLVSTNDASARRCRSCCCQCQCGGCSTCAQPCSTCSQPCSSCAQAVTACEPVQPTTTGTVGTADETPTLAFDPVTSEEQGWFDKMYGPFKAETSPEDWKVLEDGWKNSTHAKRKDAYDKIKAIEDQTIKEAGSTEKPTQPADPVTAEEQGWFDKMYGPFKAETKPEDWKVLEDGWKNSNHAKRKETHDKMKAMEEKTIKDVEAKAKEAEAKAKAAEAKAAADAKAKDAEAKAAADAKAKGAEKKTEPNKLDKPVLSK